ncbi:MAG: hypothetical protein J6W00_07820 [Lentisphaeria bacterium]|nr:hypothetical protein [Lentisphaeria bacterium]
MRKTLCQIALLLFAFTVFGNNNGPAVWNGENNFQNWKHFGNATGTVVNGVITMTDIRFDCRMSNYKVNFAPKNYDTFTYTYRAFDGAGKQGGELFFSHAGEKFADKRKWHLPPMVADGQWHTVSVTPDDFTSFRTGGMITSLRFDPTNAAGGKIEIKELKFEKRITPPEKIIWNKDNFALWTYSYNTKKEVIDGILTLTDIKKDCNIGIKKLKIDPKLYNTFTFTYRAEGTGKGGGQLYFAHPKQFYSDARSCRIAQLTADGQWHTVSVSPKDMESWLTGGNIIQLRFDPTDSPGGKIEIKEMILEKRDLAALKKNSFEVTEAKLDAPQWPNLKSEIWRNGSKNIQEGKHYFQGKMIKSPEDKIRGGKHHEFFLRREFELKEKPVHGYLQYTADDCAQAFVNGHSAGFSNDWRSCQVYNVSDFLQAGKNVLGIHYFNTNTYGGVIAELYVQYADGSCERINSDENFKSNIKKQSGWNKAGFDDSSWAGILHCAPPPAAPWGIRLPYRYFSDMQQVKNISLAPEKVTAGERVRIQITCKGKIPDTPVTVSVLLKKNLIWRDEIRVDKSNFVPGENGLWTLDFNYQVPLYFNNKYTVSLESDIFSANSGSTGEITLDIKRINRDPKFAKKNTFQVVRAASGNPVFQLNGKPFFAAWVNPPAKYQSNAPIPANVATVHFQIIHWWGKGDTILTDVLDHEAQRVARDFPDAYFMWTLHCTFPADWRSNNPDEMCQDENGLPNSDRYSLASLKARHDFEKQMLKAIEYLEKSPYANRIIGYRITGGHSIEWLGWESASGKALDFSPAGKKAFAAFAKEKYPQLDNFTVPSGAERSKRDGKSLLWEQKKHLKAIVYNDFSSNMTADFMLHLAKKTKELVGKDKVIGTYYGYVSTLHHTGRSQYRNHYALKKVLDSGAVDYIMSPQSYPLRNMGDTCGEMKPFASFLKNNIIPVCEDDTRTHNGYDVKGSQIQTITEKQTVAQELRNMTIAICRNSPNYYYPLIYGTEISFPAMTGLINTLKITGQHILDNNTARNAQIALVVSEESIKAMPPVTQKVRSGIIDQYYKGNGNVTQRERIRPVLTFESFIGNQGRFNRSGAPVDQLLAEDLADNPGNYKLYVFINCFKYDDKFLAAVKKLQQRDCVLLWLYAPGYIKGVNSSTANMKELTGLDFSRIDNGIPAAVIRNDGSLLGTPAANVTPMFAVNTPGVEVLGKYNNGQTGIAAMRTGKALSIFSGVWQLDMKFISDILDRAGVFRYSKTLDPFEANDSLLMLHTRYPGKKVITLPRKTDVLNIISGEMMRNTDRIEFNTGLHETSCFYYGDDAKKLQEKLKKER